jgi:hypothetical protein
MTEAFAVARCCSRSGLALQEGDLACMSVPEVRLTRKKLKRCILDFALCSPGAADDD